MARERPESVEAEGGAGTSSLGASMARASTEVGGSVEPTVTPPAVSGLEQEAFVSILQDRRRQAPDRVLIGERERANAEAMKRGGYLLLAGVPLSADGEGHELILSPSITNKMSERNLTMHPDGSSTVTVASSSLSDHDKG